MPDTIEPSPSGRFHAQHEKLRLESCRRTIASSTKLGAWRRTGVRAQRTGRRTHRVHPATSLVLNRCRAARAGMSIGNRENLRHTAQRAIPAEQGRMSSASRGRRRKAPSTQPSSAPPMPACPSAHPAALQRAQRRRSATGAAVWPRQGPAAPHRAPAGARRHAAVAAPARALP